MPNKFQNRKVHFIGIGGIGMSGIAELLLGLGHEISGSDMSQSETVQRLKKLGAKIQIGHGADIFKDSKPDVVVFSSAVAKSNPELEHAKKENIPIIRRAEMLAEIMRLKRGIAIAGSHGKTTTTGIVSTIVKQAGLDPTVVIGGRFDAIGSNALLGRGEWMIAEADESDGSFLKLSPEIAIVTNIDHEHLDFYTNFDMALNAFEEFMDRIPFYGRIIVSKDCPHLRALCKKIAKPLLTYGLHKEHFPDVLTEIISQGKETKFNLRRKTDSYNAIWMELKICVPGKHNVLNATAAALASLELGVSAEQIKSALPTFSGVQRRFQNRGEWFGHPVIEDYAHHPTEILATLDATQVLYKDLSPVVIFQPHRYSRTRHLWKEFKTCFQGAQNVITLPIYAASEAKEAWTDEFDNESFSKNISTCKANFAKDREAALKVLQELEPKLKKGAPILILGAGDIPKIIPDILKKS